MFDKKIIIGSLIGCVGALILYNLVLVRFLPASLEDDNLE